MLQAAKEKRLFLIECMIAHNPHPETGKRVFKDPVHGGMTVRDISSYTSWEESCDRVFKFMEEFKLARDFPNATLEMAGILWMDRKEYDDIQAAVWAKLRTRYPNVIVEISDDAG